MINATICLLTHLLLVLLVSFFDVRRYNGSYLSCSYAPCPMRFTAFIVESVVKNYQFPAIHGGFKILYTLNCKKKIN